MFFIFLVFILVTNTIEFFLYKTLFNPYSLISLVYCFLISLNNYYAVSRFSFFEVEDKTMIFLSFFLLLVFIISILFRFLSIEKTSTRLNLCEYKEMIFKKEKVILIFFDIGLIAKYISLFQSISRYGFDNLKGNAFGIFAHIGSLAGILLPFVFLIYLSDKKKFFRLITFLLVLVNILIFGGKYLILITVLYVIIFYALINRVSTSKVIRYSLIALIFAILVFFFNYVVRPILELGYFNSDLTKNNFDFAIQHFFYYLLSPVIAMNSYFSVILNSQIGIPILFTVPINIFKALFRVGNYVSPIYEDTVQISPGWGTNVAGFFAEAIHTGGWLIGTVTIIFFFVFVYYCYVKYIRYSRLTALTSYLLSVVIFMFFCNFLTVSGVVLNIMYLVVLEILLTKKITL
ncbi:TPA: O-antigen polymerase [Enterococcus faecium]|uniref:O-antigen polymerase n=1 Tax=Enterococcus faecium TaxID=1352 RepID=UPI0006671E8D|nr:O-antigen polymerase [Enterococcus faecium]MDW3718628.1 O-antigen polymerase [Enterococcus faecium]